MQQEPGCLQNGGTRGSLNRIGSRGIVLVLLPSLKHTFWKPPFVNSPKRKSWERWTYLLLLLSSELHPMSFEIRIQWIVFIPPFVSSIERRFESATMDTPKQGYQAIADERFLLFLRSILALRSIANAYLLFFRIRFMMYQGCFSLSGSFVSFHERSKRKRGCDSKSSSYSFSKRAGFVERSLFRSTFFFFLAQGRSITCLRRENC